MSPRLPELTPAQMIRALQRAGFVEVRQTGSHCIMYRPGLTRTIPVPRHPGSLKRRLQERIIKEAGFTLEEFRQYLD